MTTLGKQEKRHMKVIHAASIALGAMLAFSGYTTTKAADEPGYQPPHMPVDGGYHDPQKPGSALFLQDVGKGRYFGVMASYDASGEPQWTSFVTSFREAHDGVQQITMATASAQPQKTRNGTCVGCAGYAAPVYADEGGVVNITALSPNAVEVEVNGVKSTMIRQFPPPPGDTVPGRADIGGIFHVEVWVEGTLLAEGQVHAFGVPMSHPLAQIEDHENGIGVNGLYCFDRACGEELQPIFEANVESPESVRVRPIVVWDRGKQKITIKSMKQIEASPSANWLEVANGFEAELWQTSRETYSGRGVVDAGNGPAQAVVEVEFIRGLAQ